jgi:hypothetical protein
MEFALFGIPVVVHNPDLLTAYPPELAYLVFKKEDYENSLDQALTDGKSLDQAILAFRWFNFRFNLSTVSLIENKKKPLLFFLRLIKKYKKAFKWFPKVVLRIFVHQLQMKIPDGVEYKDFINSNHLDIPLSNKYRQSAERRRISRHLRKFYSTDKFDQLRGSP